MLYIGIDLGTSAVKLLLMDEEGQIKNEISREYPLEFLSIPPPFGAVEFFVVNLFKVE